MLDWPLLSLVIWVPIVGGVLALWAGRRGNNNQLVRWVSLVSALITFLLSTLLWVGFDTTTAAMQFVEHAPWIPALDIYYYLGIDGISMPLIILTTLMTLLVVILAWDGVGYKPAQYFASFLIMGGLMTGIFAALDGILFYVFFEAMLIPMFLIIGVWGSERRVYAAIKFYLYTFLGSVFMLVALIYLYMKGGTFNILAWQEMSLSLTEQIWIFIGFALAFAVKIPMIPVHTWLPDAHVEAPTGGSIILAAILLKIGGYGFLRFNLPITPDASALLDTVMIVLSLLAIIYIALVALAQRNMKKLVAYSSISHMGFVTLGTFIVFGLIASDGNALMAAQGAIVQMISHGFVSAALFICVGVLYDRLHTKEISAYKGLADVMPWFATLMVLFSFANVGLPGTSGFVGEFLVILSTFQANPWYAAFAVLTLILGASYTLYLVKRIIWGKVESRDVEKMPDLTKREGIVLGVLAAGVLLVGIWPAPLMEVTEASVRNLIAHLAVATTP